MKRIFTPRIVLYAVYALVFFGAILYMDTIPDHSDGTADYRTWLIWVYFPMLFICHGAVSKLILYRYGFYIPLAVTAVLGFTEAMISQSNTALLYGIETDSLVVSALAVTAVYLAYTAAGVLVTKGLGLLLGAIRRASPVVRGGVADGEGKRSE